MQESYYELIITPNRDLKLFCDLAYEITQNTIEESENSLIIRDSEPLDNVQWAIEQFANKLNIPISTQISKKENIDWINQYKNSISPIEVGSFYIRPDWEKKKDDLIDIIINPALAFGSGHHETTASCIQAIDAYIQKDQTLLDVGCGSGILAIAANKKGAICDICDTDEIAIDSAKENFILNSATINNSWVGSVNKSKETYDFVIANIIADIILLINKDLKKAVKSGGLLILSGIIDKYHKDIQNKFQDFDTIQHIIKGEWHTFILKRK